MPKKCLELLEDYRVPRACFHNSYKSLRLFTGARLTAKNSSEAFLHGFQIESVMISKAWQGIGLWSPYHITHVRQAFCSQMSREKRILHPRMGASLKITSNIITLTLG